MASSRSWCALGAPMVLARVRVQRAEPDAHVALRGAPQRGEDADVPAAHRGVEQREVEGDVAVVDGVDRERLVAEVLRVALEPVESGVGDLQARAAGDLGLDLAAQPVDRLEVLEVERGDHRAAAGTGDHEALGLEVAQRLADRDEADAEHPGRLAQRERASSNT